MMPSNTIVRRPSGVIASKLILPPKLEFGDGSDGVVESMNVGAVTVVGTVTTGATGRCPEPDGCSLVVGKSGTVSSGVGPGILTKGEGVERPGVSSPTVRP